MEGQAVIELKSKPTCLNILQDSFRVLETFMLLNSNTLMVQLFLECAIFSLLKSSNIYCLEILSVLSNVVKYFG